MSYIKTLFAFHASLWYLTSDKKIHGHTFSSSWDLRGGVHPQMPVSCQKKQIPLTVKMCNDFYASLWVLMICRSEKPRKIILMNLSRLIKIRIKFKFTNLHFCLYRIYLINFLLYFFVTIPRLGFPENMVPKVWVQMSFSLSNSFKEWC